MQVNKNRVIVINQFDERNGQASFSIARPLEVPHWQALEFNPRTSRLVEHMRDCPPSCTKFAISAAWFDTGIRHAHPTQESLLAITRSAAARVGEVLRLSGLDVETYDDNPPLTQTDEQMTSSEEGDQQLDFDDMSLTA